MSPGSPAEAAASGRVLAIVALAAEAKTLASQRNRMAIRVSGPGEAAAARATESNLHLRPRLVLSWGVAGALDPGLSPGDLLRPTTVLSSESGERFDSAVSGGAKTVLVSVRSPVGSPEQRLALARHTGAAAVDMESAAVAAICQREGIPFQCVRAISDSVDHRLPAWVGKLMTADGQLAPWRTLAELLRDPLALPDLLRAGAGFRLALRSLEHHARQLEL